MRATYEVRLDEKFETAMRYGGYSEAFRRRVAEKRRAEAMQRRHDIRADAERQANVSAIPRQILSNRSAPTWVGNVVAEVAFKHGIEPLKLVSACRSFKVVVARNEAIYRIKETKPQTALTKIASWFAKDHTSICHALAAHADLTGAAPLTGYNIVHARQRNATRSRNALREARQ